jgi:membrane fusion protein, multidrug efflux system
MKKKSGHRTNHQTLIIIIAAACVFWWWGCKQQSDKGIRPQGPISVSVYSIVEAPFTQEIVTTGELMPDEETEIRAPLSGNVMQIHFREGQKVQQGALLLELDHRIWVSRKKGLEARLASAMSELLRRKALVQVEGVSQSEYEQSLAEADQLKAQIEELDVIIDQAMIRAPFAGTVGLRGFSPGSYMAQGSFITRLVSTNRLKVRFTLSGKHSSLIRPGQTILVRSSSGKHQAEAVVYAIDPAIQTTSRTLEVRAYLDNSNGQFMAGDFAEITMRLAEQPETILIPAAAVTPELNQQIVFIAADTLAKRRIVKTGVRTRNQIEITEGLVAGEKVILTGLMTIKDGASIRIMHNEKEVTK